MSEREQGLGWCLGVLVICDDVAVTCFPSVGKFLLLTRARPRCNLVLCVCVQHYPRADFADVSPMPVCLTPLCPPYAAVLPDPRPVKRLRSLFL